MGKRGLPAVGAAAEEHAKLGDRRGEAEIRRGVFKRRAGVLEGEHSLLARVARRLLVAELEREQLARRRADVSSYGRLRRHSLLRLILERLVDDRTLVSSGGGDDLIEGRHTVAGADLAGVLRVVFEILRRHDPVFVAEEPVGGDLGGIELHLDLHILGDRHRAPGELLDEHLPRLPRPVDVGIDPVAVVGELLHLLVLEVPLAVAEDGEEHPSRRLLLDQLDKRRVARDADIEIAIGGQDDPVRAPLHKRLGGLGVGELDPGRAVG